jgi:hypothetical protein
MNPGKLVTVTDFTRLDRTLIGAQSLLSVPD